MTNTKDTTMGTVPGTAAGAGALAPAPGRRKYTKPARDYLARLVKPGGSAVAFVKTLSRDGGFSWTYDASKARRFSLDQIHGAVRMHSPQLVVEAVKVERG